MRAKRSEVKGEMDNQGKRRRARDTPKGRQVDPQALAEVRSLLGGAERRRDLLIEYLHLIQDHYHELKTTHLAALAQEMGLAQTEVFEVATFYAHFDIRHENDLPLPPLTVRVCDSLSCALFGANELLAELEAREKAGVRIVTAPCMGRCAEAPVAEVGRRHVDNATVDAIFRTLDEWTPDSSLFSLAKMHSIQVAQQRHPPPRPNTTETPLSKQPRRGWRL